MASLLQILLVAACVINACNCQIFGLVNMTSYSPSNFLTYQDNYNPIVITNAEFVGDFFLTAVEFFATGPGELSLGFVGFRECGRPNQPRCEAFIQDYFTNSKPFPESVELARMTIPVSGAGLIKYELPQKVLIARGYTPYIIQSTTGISFVQSTSPSYLSYWGSSITRMYKPLTTSAGSPIMGLIRFYTPSSTAATLSADTITYGIPVPTQADANTVLTEPLGFSFLVVNAPILYDTYISSFNIFAAAAGDLTIRAMTYKGCETQPCANVLANFKQTGTPYFMGIRTTSYANAITVNLKQGYNQITLATPLFVQRNSVFNIMLVAGRPALQKVASLALPDLRLGPDDNMQYARVGTNPNQAFLFQAVGKYFAP